MRRCYGSSSKAKVKRSATEAETLLKPPRHQRRRATRRVIEFGPKTPSRSPAASWQGRGKLVNAPLKTARSHFKHEQPSEIHLRAAGVCTASDKSEPRTLVLFNIARSSTGGTGWHFARRHLYAAGSLTTHTLAILVELTIRGSQSWRWPLSSAACQRRKRGLEHDTLVSFIKRRP